MGLQAQVERLRRYDGIVDAEARARETVEEGQRLANAALEKARAGAAQMKAEAEQTVQSAAQRAAGLAEEATREANLRVLTAESAALEAEKLAAKAERRAADNTRTAEAMKNVIEGYGDRYVIPTFTVLDQIADQYDFEKAGAELKAARARLRGLIRSGQAATCDYVEANRRETAVAFVLDAFNGKVDSILADVREDNFGTLSQKLNDAFALVNHHGRAFRDARITQEYLSAAQAELRWAVAVHELKVRDREEQRLIKEQIREEERAQREFEKAAKEAEKEELMLRKAMAKVQQEVARAGEEQRMLFEEELRALTERLRQAEEKNQRALSMAQQTRAGHVYIISNEGSFGEHVYKIGLTRRLEPMDRIRELGDASVPFEFDVHALIRSEDAPALERALQKRFLRAQINKVNPRKEFFRVTLEEVRAEVERQGLHAAWTMTAACRSWRETQALERALFTKQLDEKAWMASQLETPLAADDEPAKEATG
ncbi:MAG TPA: DUF4041 domain-containing protein [Polyangia bacterium]